MKTLKPSLNWLLWALVTALYSPVFFQLYTARWEFIDYTHAYFILPISLFMVWQKRGILAGSVSVSHPIGYGLTLLTGLFFFFIGWRFDYIFIATFSLLPVTAALTGLLYGNKALKLILLPLAYLLFLVPPPLGVLDSVTLPMRYGVSWMTDKILLALNYPVTRDGLLLSIGGNEVYMGEACSGFRSLIALGSLGTAYIYTMRIDAQKKWVLGLSIIPLALAGNLVRVVSVCLVTYYLGVSKGQQYYHDISGLVIFLVLIAGLLWIEKILTSRSQ